MKNLFLLLVVLAIATTFAQTSILVFDFKSTGLDDATVASVHELFKSELTEYGYSVIDAPGKEICQDDACAAQAAKKEGTAQALYGSLSKLGDKIIISIYVVDPSGAKVHNDKLTSESVENLDVVIGRLVRALFEGKKAGDTIDKTNVTDTESKETVHRKNYYTVGANIGYRFPIGDSYGKEQMFLYEAIAMYEMEKVFVGARGYYSSGGEAYSGGLNIGGYYIFSPKDISPFAGAALGIEWASIPVENEEEGYTEWFGDNGPSILISGGLLMFQTYDFHLLVELRYQAVFLGEVDYRWDYGDDKTYDAGTQHTIGMSIGITRKTSSNERSGSACCMPW